MLGNPNQWFNPNAFVLPAAGTYGRPRPRHLHRARAWRIWICRCSRTFADQRALNLQFRAEFFNVLNHANFGTPNAIVFSGSGDQPDGGTDHCDGDHVAADSVRDEADVLK